MNKSEGKTKILRHARFEDGKVVLPSNEKKIIYLI